jgi:hypothetical protein
VLTYVENYMNILHMLMYVQLIFFKYDRFFFIKNKTLYVLQFLSLYYGSSSWITILKKLCYLSDTRNHPCSKVGYQWWTGNDLKRDWCGLLGSTIPLLNWQHPWKASVKIHSSTNLKCRCFIRGPINSSVSALWYSLHSQPIILLQLHIMVHCLYMLQLLVTRFIVNSHLVRQESEVVYSCAFIDCSSRSIKTCLNAGRSLVF